VSYKVPVGVLKLTILRHVYDVMGSVTIICFRFFSTLPVTTDELTTGRIQKLVHINKLRLRGSYGA